jgi:chitinase
MFKRQLILLAAAGTLLAGTSRSSAQTPCAKRLLAFYAYYDGGYGASNIPYNELTHIAHAFLSINADGSLMAPSGLVNPTLISDAHAAGVKVLISVGGADVTTFSGVAANSAYTSTFVNQLYSFIQANGYDGVDIDWEFPDSTADLDNAPAFFATIRNQFNSSPAPAPGWEISFDIEGDSYWGQWLNFSALDQDVSFYNLESYGQTGSWAGHTNFDCALFTDPADPYGDDTCQSELDYLLNTRAVPASMINMGLPFFAVEFPDNNTPYQTCGACTGVTNPTYPQVVSLLSSGWTANWDTASQVPWATNGTGFITYENAESVTLKVNYALGTRNVGGVAIWEISQDFMSTAPNQPLMDAMYDAWQVNCPTYTLTPTPSPTLSPTPSPTLTITLTPVYSYTPTPTPTITLTPTPTATSYVAAPPGGGILYPNPAQSGNSVNLRLGLSSPSPVEIKVFTLSFRKVQDRTYPQVEAQGMVPIPLSDEAGKPLANGLYYLVVNTNQGNFIEKLLVVK